MTSARRDAQYQGPELEFTDEDAPDAVRALLRAARDVPEAGVITHTPDGSGGTLLTYPELLFRARLLLAGLRAHGVRPGDPVVLSGLPLGAFFPALWACLLGGALPVPIAARPEDGSPALTRLRGTAALLNGPLILTDGPGAAGLARTDPALRAVDADDLPHAGRDHQDDTTAPAEPDGDDTALLLLSSGSTGAPKAVRLTHHGLALFGASTRRILDLRPGDTTVNWLPVDHSGAFLLYHLLPVFAGATNVHTPTDGVLADPLRWLDLLEEHRATHSWAPAFGFQLVTDALTTGAGTPPDRDLTRVRSLVCGGERVTEPGMRRFLAATGRYGLRAGHLVPAWGMTETVTGITFGRLDRPGTVQRVLRDSLEDEVRPAPPEAPEHSVLTFIASGAPAHRSTLRVVDDHGRLLPERHIGRLQVASPRITPGYVHDPQADAVAFPDGPRWLETGDLAYLTDGQLVMTGRRKDVIILNGLNVLCQEIEEAAATVDGVRAGAVAACGVPGERGGSETLAVFFVGGPDPATDERTARAVRAALFARLRLTADRVVAVPEDRFPRTPAGKIRRAALLERLLAGGFDPPDPRTVVADEVSAVLGRPVTGAEDTPFYELGLDSVRMVRLRARLEQTLERPVPQTALFEHPTVTALAAHLAGDAAHPGRKATAPAPDIGGPDADGAGTDGPGTPVPVSGVPADGASAAAAPDTGAPAASAPDGSASVPPAPAASVPPASAPEPPADRRIAVIGMAARFPGAPDIDTYWRNLHDGVDSVRTLPSPPGGGRVPVIGALQDIDDFDADFFGITPREAGHTHPAQRLFLEICHGALEHSGYAGDEDSRGRTAVFAGSGMQLYGHQDHGGTAGPGPADPAAGDPVEAMQRALGTQPDFLATRVAYRLGLTGPAIGVQTACSSSLVAVHLAAQALLSGDADVALAGAAAVHPAQDTGYRPHPGSILSPSGRCRPFDAAADGTVGGNGVAAVVLKRLDRALADGDTVHAVLLGSAVNNDGAGKVGFSAPGVAGQAAVVRDALRAAGIAGETVSYVEAHGTGTALGDPVEYEALARALGEGTDRTGFCTVGSVKSAIGHLDTCAGMAGLIKTVLMLRHRTLLPTLHLQTPHPALPLTGGPLTLATSRRPWQLPPGSPRRAGVSALGVGGTNAHVILEEAPAPQPKEEAGTVVLPLSARDASALADLTAALAQHLRDHPDLSPADVATTLALGRHHHRGARHAVTGTTLGELIEALQSPAPAPAPPLGRTAFAFSGQGAPPGTLEALTAELAPGGDGEADGGQREAQAALFTAQLTLAQRWTALGIRPELVLAHSLGEYAALCTAGGLSPADGLALTTVRGRLMRELAPPGAAVALRADLATAERVARAAGVDVAAVNGPRSIVLSGPEPALAEARRLLEAEGIRTRTLPVERAFHSATLDRALEAFRAHAEAVTFTPLRIPLISGLDGEIRPVGWAPDAEHLIRHARRPVRFDLAMATAARAGIADFLEIGPGATLAGLGRHCVPESRWLSGLLPALAELYRRGHDIPGHAWPRTGSRIPLPGYPLRPRTFPAWGEAAVPLAPVPPADPAGATVPAAPDRAVGPANAPDPATPADPAAPGAPATRAVAGETDLPGVPEQPRPPDGAARPPAPPSAPGIPAGDFAAPGDEPGRGVASAMAEATPAPADRTAGSPRGAASTPEPRGSLAQGDDMSLNEPVTDSGPVLADVRALTARKLGVEPADVEPDASFFALGADSLALMGMTAELEQRYGVRIPVRELFADADTPERLTALITARAPATAGGPREAAPPQPGTTAAAGVAGGSEPTAGPPAGDPAPQQTAVAGVEGPPGSAGSALAPRAAGSAAGARPDGPHGSGDPLPGTAPGPVLGEPLPALPATPGTSAEGHGQEPVAHLFAEQLRTARHLMDQVTQLMSRQLDLVASDPAVGGTQPAGPPVAAPEAASTAAAPAASPAAAAPSAAPAGPGRSVPGDSGPGGASVQPSAAASVASSVRTPAPEPSAPDAGAASARPDRPPVSRPGGPGRTSAAPLPSAGAPAPADGAGRPAAAVPAASPAGPGTALPAPTSATRITGPGPDFSLYFFGDYPEEQQRDKYDLIMAAGEFADQHGFHALWFPERHFDSFGALFPNPSVLAAALAARTRRVRLHAGSVVLPLHHPARVAEEWSVVDNISGGRAGLCVASGWHARDFALAPQNFGRHRELMYEQLATVRQLWAGDPVEVTAGDGKPTEVRLQPRPLQDQPPLFVAVVGNPDSYRRAAAEDLGIVTNLMAQTVEQLAENIALYRRTRAEHGLDPAAGRVVVLVHTFLAEDAATARAEAYRPFLSYLRSSLALFNQVTNSLGVEVDLERTHPDDVDFLLGRAYERYCDARALIGDEASTARTVTALTDAGADEIACFVDFGVPPDRVLGALPLLDRLRRTTAEQRLPLSAAQRRIWVQEQLQPGTRMYHEPKAIRLDGPLDPEAVHGALHRVIARQPALRTVFGQRDDGSPYRRVHERLTVELPVTDLTGATEEEALRAALDLAARETFDLAEGPLLAARLLRLGPERQLLFLVAHHLILDSASTAVLARELTAQLRAWPHPAELPPLRPTATPPPDPGRLAADLAFWRAELDGAPDLALPTDHPRPARRTGEGAALSHELDGALMDRLARYCAEQRATVFMAMTAAVAAVLGRFGGTTDLVLGTAVDARPPQAGNEIGLFLDTVALRVDLSGDPGFGTLLRRVRDRSTEAFEHRQVPFDELVRALNPERDPGRNPLFQVMVEYERQTDSALLDVPSDRAPFDLSLYLTHHSAGLRLMAEYDTALFTERTVRRLADYVEQLLRRVLSTPDAPLSVLTALTDTDRAELAAAHTPGPPARAGADDTLHALFARQAARTPDAVALRTAADGSTVSYRELADRAHTLARSLRARGARRGERVGVLLPRGPSLITALLAVLRSGAAYVPLDPALPTARLAHLVADSDPVLLLTGAETLAAHEGLRARTDAEVLYAPEPGAAEATPGDLTDPADPADPAELDDPAGPDDPAYCLYTSGSTGEPKGVIVPHRGPAQLIRGQLAAHPPLRTLQWTSPAFDVHVQEVFTTLAAGAELVLIDDAVRYDPAAVAAVVRDHRVGRLFMPCTPLRYLMETQPRLPGLRELFSAGEALELTPAFRRFLAAHPDCALFNQYGPTEASIVVTSHRATEDRPPIGRPLPGVRIRLLDGAGAEVPPGAVGEIEIGGPAVALGYHRRPRETAAAFGTGETGERTYRTGDLARWRTDGTLAYLGRTDDQVKIRGYRVEPAEVRAALTRLPGVREAAVLARPDRRGEAELVAYVVPAGEDTDLAALRTRLASALPGHLVPRHWVPLERLPVNASGKLDRDRLPAPSPDAAPPGDDGGPGDEPGTPMEKALHDLWCDELGLPGQISVTRSFFQLGGHSLGAIRLVNRMTREAGRPLAMADFFRAPTIRECAAHFTAEPAPAPRAEAESAPGPAAGEVADTVPAPSALRRLTGRHRAHPHPGVFNVAHRVELTGALDEGALTGALRALVARHPALRARVAGERVEILAEAEVEVEVTETELAGLSDADIDRWCQETARQPFDLARAPLFRFRIGRLAPDRRLLLVVLHHAVCDGWSMGLLWRDLSALYAGRPLPRPAAGYPDYARWADAQLTGERRETLERFWRTELAGVPLRPALPADRSRPPVLSGRGALHTVTLTGELPARVRAVAGELGTTPYAVLAGAFAVWLAGVCEQPDVVLAASSANRAAVREHEEVFGLLGEAVALRARLPEADTFAELAARLGPSLFAAMDHQALPLGEVVRLVAPEYAAGLFPTVLFTVVTTDPPALELPGVRAEIAALPVAGTARTELYVVLTPGEDALTVTMEYSTDLFEAATVAGWGRELAAVLDRLTADPGAPLSGAGEADSGEG
ncbi:amino acid adenylation domain-containing protein [Streptomyces harbinensis]|uniref:non-ribosomal peptide synthetase/type I polyketide synthase n=1 Tax=Streptomyces harbinensis TaxID=1176198 RepID=UPI00339485CF